AAIGRVSTSMASVDHVASCRSRSEWPIPGGRAARPAGRRDRARWRQGRRAGRVPARSDRPDPGGRLPVMRGVSRAEAVAVVRSGDRVYVHCAAATPSVLLDALVERASELRDVTVVHLHTEGPGPHLAPEMAGHFRHRALFVGPNARAAVNEGRADY